LLGFLGWGRRTLAATEQLFAAQPRVPFQPLAGFAGVPANQEKKNALCNRSDLQPLSIACRHPLSPHQTFKEKRGKTGYMTYLYGRFFSIKTTAMPTAKIAMKRLAIAGRKYKSAADGGCVGCGVAVAAGSEAYMPVDACEL
jgi:hypothetical protein